jgi:hypothetical protein
MLKSTLPETCGMRGNQTCSMTLKLLNLEGDLGVGALPYTGSWVWDLPFH